MWQPPTTRPAEHNAGVALVVQSLTYKMGRGHMFVSLDPSTPAFADVLDTTLRFLDLSFRPELSQ